MKTSYAEFRKLDTLMLVWIVILVASSGWSPEAYGDVYTAGNPIPQVSILNPTTDEVWLVQTPHTLTCDFAEDQDCNVTTGEGEGDSVTHWWEAGSGAFNDNDFVGESVTYHCPTTDGYVTFTVHRDDDYAGDDPANTFLSDEDEVTAMECVEVVGLEVFRVGFGGDNPLYRTPTTGSEWADSTTAIADPVYDADDSPAEQAAKNHVCFTIGRTDSTVTVQCRATSNLTEPATFQILGSGYSDWDSDVHLTIAAGQRVSSSATLALDGDPVNPYVDAMEGNYNMLWEYGCGDGLAVWQDINTTSHSMYATYGTPAGSVATVKRIAWACEAAKYRTSIDYIVIDAHEVVNGLYDTGPAFDGGTDEWPDGTPPIWMMLDPSHEGGSCIAFSNLLKHTVNILGVPGGVLVKVWSSTDTNFDSQETHTIDGKSCTVMVVVAVPGGGNSPNYYEGCLSINSKYYPGAFGFSSYASKEAVHDSYASWSNRLLYMTQSSPRKFFDKNHTEYTNPLDVTQSNCIPLP